jgi:hypothetical protein
MTNRVMVTVPFTTVKYLNLRATVYWDKKSYMTVYIGDGRKIFNTIYLPVDKTFLSVLNGDKELIIEQISSNLYLYLRDIHQKNEALKRKRNLLKSFVSFRVKNNLPFFLLKKFINKNFL